MLFNKNPEGVSEFVNDIDGELMNFWEVLQSEAGFLELGHRLASTPLSKKIFYKLKEMRNAKPNTAIERAISFFVMNRQSRQALGKDFVTPTKRLRRGMNEQVSAWMGSVDMLPEAHERLMRVEIWNEKALDVIEKLDGEDTLFYCDPPYLHETRETKHEYGPHEMTPEDHEELLMALRNIKGKFLLSGYDSKMYAAVEFQCRWRKHKHEIPNNASGKKKKDTKVECVWTNF